MSEDLLEVLAIAYARIDRRSALNFIDGDPHDGPMPLFYDVWVIRNGQRTILVDIGFDQRGAARAHDPSTDGRGAGRRGHRCRPGNRRCDHAHAP